MKAFYALTYDRLVNILDYNPDTGVFRWLDNRGSVRAGDVAGCITQSGYVKINILGTARKAHRLAWLYHYGRWPADQIDHINGIKHDNRIANLREATASQNIQNQLRSHKGNKTGLTGVSAGYKGQFNASIMVDECVNHLGTFSTAEEAHDAYLAAKRRLHPFWADADTQKGPQ